MTIAMPQPFEVIELAGLKVALNPDLMSHHIIKTLRNGRFLRQEIQFLSQHLKAKDRVLIVGSGYGVMSAVLAQNLPHSQIHVVETDPQFLKHAQLTHQQNDCSGIELNHVAPQSADQNHTILADYIDDTQASFVFVDLGFLDFFAVENCDLSNVSTLLLKTKPAKAEVSPQAKERMARLLGGLAKQGFDLDPKTQDQGLMLFTRPRIEPAAPPKHTPVPKVSKLHFKPWARQPDLQNPNIFVATCMKDEGPFILEWLAWTKALGVKNITVFTNDCTDGTDLLLDRLAQLGHLTHLPNPAFLADSTAFQPIALDYIQQLRETREADFFISMDVDEFINVQTGDQTLSALLQAAGPFDVLSMSEVNHGSNMQEHYEPGWITELFPAHESTHPGANKSRRGVKSIVYLSERVEKLRNHRPDMKKNLGPIVWRDGSGRETTHFQNDHKENGHDCRGTFNLVRLDHFPLRSLESYLAKMYRGDVVVMGKSVSRTYWRQRNRAVEATTNWTPQMQRAKEWYATYLASDPYLMTLHQACCDAHKDRIQHLLQDPVFIERRDWALSEAWASGAVKDD